MTFLSLQPLSCPPAMHFITTARLNKQNKSRYLIRGDSEGYVLVWSIPEISAAQLEEIQRQKLPQPVTMKATLTTSLTEAWAGVKPSPVGILDQLEKQEGQCKILYCLNNWLIQNYYYSNLNYNKFLVPHLTGKSGVP